MGLLDNLISRLGYSKAKPADMSPILQATGAGQAWSVPDMSLADAQEELFQRLSWVYGAVMAVADLAASATLNVKRVMGEKLKDVPNHELELRLLRPNPLDSRSELMIKTIAYRCLTGNAYWFLNRPDEKTPPAEIWVLPPHQITPHPDGKMFIDGYDYEPGVGEETKRLEPWQVVHFKSFHPRNWFVGLSPIEALATVAAGDLKAQEWNANFFGKNNAKVPGALVFADDVGEMAWDKLKREAREQWGGTNRSGAMMLRGSGKGGVQWVSMTLSQKDMEFLASRTFTKEEIYSIYAPGLASVLAVNATEANAKSGKATLIDMAVWPKLVAIAEKLTNNLLPVYAKDGEELVAEFDDIRITDRVLAMQEQTAYGTVHTVNEIREKFYDAKKLKDARGDLLPAQIGPATPGPVVEDAPALADNMPPMQPLDNAQPAPDAMPPGTTPMDELEQDLETAPIVKAEQASLKELSAWRRYAVRHGAAKAATFATEHIPDDLAERIRADLATATTLDEIKAVFAKAQDTKLPAPPAPDDKDRLTSEEKIKQAMTELFAAQRKRVEQAVRSGNT